MKIYTYGKKKSFQIQVVFWFTVFMFISACDDIAFLLLGLIGACSLYGGWYLFMSQIVIVSSDNLIIKRGRKACKLIQWGDISKAHMVTMGIVLGVFDIQSTAKHLFIYANMSKSDYKGLLKNIVEKATRAEIDPKIKKYIAK